jgi:hypothetical protein
LASTFELIVSRIPPGTIGAMQAALRYPKMARKLRLAAEAGRIPDRSFLTAVADYTGLSMAELVAAALADAGFVLDPPLDREGRQLLRRIGELPPDARRQMADYLTFLEGR